MTDKCNYVKLCPYFRMIGSHQPGKYFLEITLDGSFQPFSKHLLEPHSEFGCAVTNLALKCKWCETFWDAGTEPCSLNQSLDEYMSYLYEQNLRSDEYD